MRAAGRGSFVRGCCVCWLWWCAGGLEDLWQLGPVIHSLSVPSPSHPLTHSNQWRFYMKMSRTARVDSFLISQWSSTVGIARYIAYGIIIAR